MTVKDRFIRYAAVDTGSDENSGTHPSSEKEWMLARMLEVELKDMGAQNVRVSEKCYVYAEIPANANGQPAIGLIAHMDTAPAVATGPVHPHSVFYKGGDLEVGHGVVMKAAEYDTLTRHIGHELILADGTTLLGGDDKAGIAEIMTTCETLLTHPEIKHGKVCIGFTPDEEIGSGADAFDVAGFGADFAYTVDGGMPDELEYENFNACSAEITVRGFNIHPGTAKNKMKNAARMAAEWVSMIPDSETPEHTEGREGFYHLCSLRGDESSAVLQYILRDHNREKFEQRKRRVTAITEYLNGKYGEGSFSLTLRDSYYNMKEKILPHMHLVEHARRAMEAVGVRPEIVPVRGGTDGAHLSFMGLPCPNLCAGGHNFHGKYEYVPVRSLEKISAILQEIVSGYARYGLEPPPKE